MRNESKLAPRSVTTSINQHNAVGVENIVEPDSSRIAISERYMVNDSAVPLKVEVQQKVPQIKKSCIIETFQLAEILPS